jgi:hypothetical protein
LFFFFFLKTIPLKNIQSMTYMLSEFYFFISKQNKNKKLIKIQLLKFLLRSYEIIQFFYWSQVENIHHYEFFFLILLFLVYCHLLCHISN